MSCGYGQPCGSRFPGYPCTSGPPILDANNNVIPKRTVLCGSGVCTHTASFRDYVSIGNVDSVVNVAELDVFGNQKVFGTLAVDPAMSPTLTAGIQLAPNSTFVSAADLDLGTTAAGPGASLVFAKASPGAPINPTRGGNLDVIFYDPEGAATAQGFLYTAQEPLYYLNAGPGIYYEEKNGAGLAQATDVVPVAAASWGCLTTTVLSSQGATVTQQFQTNTGLFGRTSNSPPTLWGPWTQIAAWAA